MKITFGCDTANTIAKKAREADIALGLATPTNDDGTFSEKQSNVHQSVEDLETAIAEAQYWEDQVYLRQEEVNRAKAAYMQSL